MRPYAVFSRQRLQNSCYKYVQRIKRKYAKLRKNIMAIIQQIGNSKEKWKVFPIKGTKNPQTNGRENTSLEYGGSCSARRARKCSKKKKNKTMTYAEGTQGPNERAPNVQSWNALSNKINIGLHTI